MALERLDTNSTERTTILADDLLHGGFESHARARPGALAVAAGDVTLTYGELAARVAAVRRVLADAGVGRGDFVAVVMQNGWEAVTALLAIVSSGAAYVPIEADLPVERVRRTIDDARPVCVLARPGAGAQALAWPGAPRVVTLGEAAGEAAPVQPVEPDDLGYVIFTSGSTGRPKGVMIAHRAAQNTIRDVNGRFSVGPADVVLAVSPFSFDLSVYDTFGLLSAGGTVAIPGPVERRSPRHLAALLHDHRVTVWNSAPPLMELVVQDLESRAARFPDSLRLVMLSGDWIDVSLPDRIRALGAEIEVVSLGGATEASIWSIYYPVRRVDPSWRSIPYGYPLANQRWYALDKAMRPCSVGERGMLYIGGTGLARGYWNDAQKTTAAFVTHPLTGERIYRTGDFGRVMDNDGTIEILGREDAQVKIRGYRVELGEIEAALHAYSGVRSARVVLDAPRGPGVASHSTQDLIAVVVAPDAGIDAVASLRAHLKRNLPPHMIPGTIRVVDALPLTANGKVDTKALVDLARRF